MIALGMLATVHAWHGDAEPANAAAARAVALADRRRLPLPAIYAHHALAMLAVASDRADEAVERLELVRAEALPGNVLWAPHLVDAYVRAGRGDDAAALVEHYARTIEHRRIAPATLERLRALTAPAAEAEAHFRAALDLHAAGPAPSSSRAPGSPTARGCSPRTAATRRASSYASRWPASSRSRRSRSPGALATSCARPARRPGRRPSARAELTPHELRVGPARRPGAHEPGSGGGAVREREDRRAPPAQRLPQARRPPPDRARAADGGSLARQRGEGPHVRHHEVGRRLGGRRRAEAVAALAAVDPHGRHAERLRRHVVVEQALGDVQDPLARDVDALEREREVRRVRLVAARLLRGHDPVELDPEAPVGEREQVVVAVRDNAEPEAPL